jgi:hypothetical protein
MEGRYYAEHSAPTYEFITREDMVEYVKARLGTPVVELEMELEERNGLGHIHMAIQDTLSWFFRENAGEAYYRDFLTIYGQPGIIEYDVPKDVVEVIDAVPSFGNGITPWTAFDIGPGETLVATTGWTQFDLVTFVGGMRYLADIKHLLGVQYQVTFHPQQHRLRLLPAPRTPRAIVCPVYTKSDLAEIFANPLFRDMAVARTQIQWGEILSKFDYQMPGGGKVDGKGILERGKNDWKELFERLKKESAPPFIMTSMST